MGQTRKEWLQTVTAQLRCRRAVPGVERELENHLSEQYNAFVAQGCAPEEAERRTVESMGDPVLAGGALDRVHRPRRPGGRFLWWRRCCWRVRCCVFSGACPFRHKACTCGARARTKAWPPPWRELLCLRRYISVWMCPCWHAGQRRSISGWRPFRLMVFWPDIP